MDYVSSSSPLTNSNGTGEKDPPSFLKDTRIKYINPLIPGQLNINSLRNEFDQLSTMINGNIDIFMISEFDETIKLDGSTAFFARLLQSLSIGSQLQRWWYYALY